MPCDEPSRGASAHGIRSAPREIPFTEQATVRERERRDRDIVEPEAGRDIPRGTDEETDPDSAQHGSGESSGTKAERERRGQDDRAEPQ